MDPDRPDQLPGRERQVPAWPQEQLLIDLQGELDGRAILCTSAGVGQFARAAAQRDREATVHCHFLDLYQADQARGLAGNGHANLSIACAADFPTGEVDVVALPLSMSGEAELARDYLQAGHERLRLQGIMAVSTDNPRDTWLHQEMQKLFDRVTRRVSDHGTVYLARKERPLKKRKNFACEFVFRDRERLIRACTRPGVFSHRKVDAGARQIMNVMEIDPGERVLEIGCGSGAASLAAALRAEGVFVHAVDSNTRAIECTARGAELNGLTNVTTELNAAGDYQHAGSYQLALANPPYYANFQIARHFLLAAKSALEPGGRLLLVTRLPQWYAEHMHEWFDDVQIMESKGYYLIGARKPE